MPDYLEVLQREFEAQEGSFLLRLRSNLEWHRAAFFQLVSAMRDYCREHADAETVERWIANGFWYIPQFTRDRTTHSQFPRPYSADYYENAYMLLDALSSWFFMGTRPYEDEKAVDAMIAKVK